MLLSRRRALATALATFAAGYARAAALLEAQGGQYPGSDGAELFYRRMGKGPPVILLHNFITDGPRAWFNTGVAQTLVGAGFSVIAPDARAHGLSAAPPGPYPKDVLAMDVEALIHTLKLKSYDLLGYAIGARTAIRLMARGARPERCVLGGTGVTGVTDVESQSATNIQTVQTGRNARDPRLGVVVQSAIRLQKLKPAALVAVLRSQVSTSRAELAQIRTPTLIVNGDKDDLEGSPAELANLLGSGALIRLPGDHFALLPDPRFAQLTADFLKSHEPPARFVAAEAL